MFPRWPAASCLRQLKWRLKTFDHALIADVQVDQVTIPSIGHARHSMCGRRLNRPPFLNPQVYKLAMGVCGLIHTFQNSQVQVIQGPSLQETAHSHRSTRSVHLSGPSQVPPRLPRKTGSLHWATSLTEGPGPLSWFGCLFCFCQITFHSWFHRVLGTAAS